MQVTVEDVSTVKKILHIDVPEEDVARELDAAYRNLKQTAKIKGFRPGKVPRSVLERMFGKDVRAEVTSRLVQDSFVEALKETQLNVVGEPKIDPPELDPKASYQYDATVEIKPEIGAIDYKGMALKKSVYQASEDEVDAQLQMLRKNLARREAVEEARPVQDGDFVLIDYEGFENGQPFNPTRKTENFTMKIGAGTILKDFDDQLVGMEKAASKEFKIRFPEDYFNKELANKEIDFKVTLKDIQKEVLPEINDQMAKDLGPFDSLEALRAEIRKNLKEGYEKRVEQELNEQIFTALIAQADFETPEVMVQYELDGILSDAERAFEASNLTMEQVGQTREKLSVKYRDVAEKQVRRHLILDAIIGQEKLTISDEELDNGFKEMAASFNQPVDVIKAFYQQNPDKVEYFKHTLLEKKAIKLILDNSNITEVEPESEAETQADQSSEAESES